VQCAKKKLLKHSLRVHIKSAQILISNVAKMVKSKKYKPPVDLTPQFRLPPQPRNQKPKKKRAPDRSQPEWMFPPDDQNPVLNPKPVNEEIERKQKEDHDTSIKFLQYKSVEAPLKAAPPGLLLTLVGGFLTSYGFSSASRLYTTQLNSRKKLDEWKVEIGER